MLIVYHFRKQHWEIDIYPILIRLWHDAFVLDARFNA